MGPCVGMGDDWGDVDLDVGRFDRNAVIACDAPSGKMNCSRNSTFVRPLAIVRENMPIFQTCERR